MHRLVTLAAFSVVWDASEPGACRSLQSKVCSVKPPTGMTSTTYAIRTMIAGVQDEATLLANMTSYLGIESDKIQISLDPITESASVSVSFDSVDEGIASARLLNSETIATAVTATSFSDPEFMLLDVGQAKQDVHLKYPGGGSADFRGEPKRLYNLFSSQEVSINIGIAESVFNLKGATINGSFMDKAYITTMVNGFVANIFVPATGTTSTSCNNAAVPIYQFANVSCGSVIIGRRMLSYTLETPHWGFRISPMPVYEHISGCKRRLDVTVFKRREGHRAHGLLGQGFNGKALDGEKDIYPASGNFTTAALAKGAIEGKAMDYVVDAPYDSDFRYTEHDQSQEALQASRSYAVAS